MITSLLRIPTGAVIGRLLDIPLAYRALSSLFDGGKAMAIARIAPDYAEAAVLDVGCGPGTNAGLFRSEGYLGVDTNAKYIRQAKRRYAEKRFEVADATQLGVTGRFDLVLVNSVLHHMDDEQVQQFLGCIRPVLTDGGAMIVLEPLIPPPGMWLPAMMRKLDRGKFFRAETHWRDLFTAAGLTVQTQDTYWVTIAALRASRLLSARLIASAEGSDQ